MIQLVKRPFFIIVSVLLVLMLFFVSMNNSFFWDTIQLGSLHAHFYYENSFSNLLLPNQIDSGHIPAFGFYLGLVWKLFGRSLFVSHLAMLPFMLGIIWQLYFLLKHYFNAKDLGIAVFIVLIDPSLLSQMTLISPDVPLVLFFLMAWRCILENNKKLLLLAIFCLFLTSMRGMMVAFCLLVFDLFKNITFKNNFKLIVRDLLQRSLIYWPALLLFICFNVYHYQAKGWIGFHSDSPWAGSFDYVDFNGFLFNIAVYGWRLLDFGKVAIWLIGVFVLLKHGKEIRTNKKTRALAFLTICLFILLPANMIWAKNLLAHRYLIPIFLVIAVFTARILLLHIKHPILKKSLLFIWIAMLLGGNLWVYPDKISQGWDATLGHLPYYHLRHKAITFLDQKQINFKDVQSFFPNKGVINFLDLNNDKRHFPSFDATSTYVFYSNVFNISDEEYNTIKSSDYELLKEFRSGTVFIQIIKKRSKD